MLMFQLGAADWQQVHSVKADDTEQTAPPCGHLIPSEAAEIFTDPVIRHDEQHYNFPKITFM